MNNYNPNPEPPGYNGKGLIIPYPEYLKIMQFVHTQKNMEDKQFDYLMGKWGHLTVSVPEPMWLKWLDYCYNWDKEPEKPAVVEKPEQVSKPTITLADQVTLHPASEFAKSQMPKPPPRAEGSK